MSNQDVEQDEEEQTAEQAGAVVATTASVVTYLVNEYKITPDAATAVVARHPEILAEGVKWGSYANYVGDKMWTAEGGTR